MGNRGVKELIGTTHGHELRWGDAGGLQRGEKGRKIGKTVIA